MRYRRLGKTGLEVSEVGLGAWQLGGPVHGLFGDRGRIAHGWGPVNDADSVAMIHNCAELGMNFIDTAAGYGAGHSEEVVGKAIFANRSKWIVETKGGEWFTGELENRRSFSRERLLEQIDESLARLQTDYVDVYLLHGPSPDDVADGGCLEALKEIKAAGKARATGVSLGSPELGLELLKHDVVEVLQVQMSIVDVRMADSLLPAAAAKGVGIVVRGVMGSGYFSGTIDASTEFSEEDRRSWQSGADRGARIAESFASLASEKRTLTQGYIKHALTFDGVSTVIVGSKRSDHMAENAGASDTPDLSQAELDEISRVRASF